MPQTRHDSSTLSPLPIHTLPDENTHTELLILDTPCQIPPFINPCTRLLQPMHTHLLQSVETISLTLQSSSRECFRSLIQRSGMALQGGGREREDQSELGGGQGGQSEEQRRGQSGMRSLIQRSGMALQGGGRRRRRRSDFTVRLEATGPIDWAQGEGGRERREKTGQSALG
jgi:hypothetical protein